MSLQMVQGGRWGAVLKPGRGHVPPAAPPMVDLLVEEYVSSTKRVIRHVLPTPASPTTSSLNVVEYWPPGVGSGSCDGLSFCLASVATSQKVSTCSKPAVVSRLPGGWKWVSLDFGAV